MNHSARTQHTVGRRIRAWTVGLAAALSDEGRRCVVRGDQAEELAVAQVEVAEAGGAEPHCIREHCLEHRLELARRTGDDFENVCGGSLLLQGFAQRVEQAGVLYSDHRLASEVRDQRDLLFGERPDFLAVDTDRTNQLIFLEHWYVEYCSRAS